MFIKCPIKRDKKNLLKENTEQMTENNNLPDHFTMHNTAWNLPLSFINTLSCTHEHKPTYTHAVHALKYHLVVSLRCATSIKDILCSVHVKMFFIHSFIENKRETIQTKGRWKNNSTISSWNKRSWSTKFWSPAIISPGHANSPLFPMLSKYHLAG